MLLQSNFVEMPKNHVRYVDSVSDIVKLRPGVKVKVATNPSKQPDWMIFYAINRDDPKQKKCTFIEIPDGYNPANPPPFSLWTSPLDKLGLPGCDVFFDYSYREHRVVEASSEEHPKVKSLVDMVC